jgi:anti-sigma B factor antagonist
MAIHVRIDGDVTILSNFGPLLNDPKHFDVGRDVDGLLDDGHRAFVLELSGLREMGPTAVGLLVTITRRVRQAGGEVVLARVARVIAAYLESMRLEEYWDSYPSVEDGIRAVSATKPKDS